MKKITVKNLIDFNRKSDNSKRTFLNNLRKEKVKLENGSGGDYWVRSTSAISNAFKLNKPELIDNKIKDIQEVLKTTSFEKTKVLYKRNIELLFGFKDFDLEGLKPKGELSFLNQAKINSLIDVAGIPVESKPSHVFSFSEKNSDEIGAIWFVCKLGGFDRNELGMFSDIMYRYLSKNYSGRYFVNPSYCIVVDIYSGKEVRFTEIQNGIIPALLEKIIGDINKI